MQQNRQRDLYFDCATVIVTEETKDGKILKHILPVTTLPKLIELCANLQAVRVLNDAYERSLKNE